MGNACTIDGDINPHDTLVSSIRGRKRQEDEHGRNLQRQKANFEARQKAIEIFNGRDGEAVSGRRRSFPCFESSLGPSLTDYADHRCQLLASMEKHLPREESPVICFNREIGEAAPGVPAFLARDHSGRLHEVVVPNPEAAFYQDEDRFLPLFHPNSPLCCEAVMGDTEEDELKKPSPSRRLRFLEKSEDVQGHLKRMAPASKSKPGAWR